ncbi:MAG: Mpv17/PMP22 family protein [Pirellulaceae bacterium]
MKSEQFTLSPRSHWLRLALQQGLAAGRANLKAGIFLWVLGTLIVLGYFYWSPCKQFLDAVGKAKEQYGILFGVVSTSLFGGIIPTLLLMKQPGRKIAFRTLLVANALFWAFKGLELDVFYRAQALMFGDDNSSKTVVLKTLFDALVYAPIIGLANVILFNRWLDLRFSLSKLWSELNPNWYVTRVLPVLISNWCVWIPAVVLIYLLPLALQLPIQNLVLVFWMLVLAILSKHADANATDASTSTTTQD